MNMQRLGLLSLVLLATSACRANYVAAPPEVENEEDLVGASSSSAAAVDSESSLDDRFGKRAELPPRPDVKEVCKGKGDARKCTKKDPKPDVTAAYGVRRFMEGFRWGMSRDDVLATLKGEIEEEYKKRQSEARDAMEQDKNRTWKRDEFEKLAKNLVTFDTRAQHKWGVSLIQFDYEDDADETMVWLRSNRNLKKFYFFKDDSLWKIIYAYSADAWPSENHTDVTDNHFKKWFGYSPEARVKQDPETFAPIVRFTEWKSSDNDIVRAFDMTAVHGVHVVAFISGDAEAKVGERLPHVVEQGLLGCGQRRLGGPSVCYDADGNFVEDAKKCEEIMMQGEQ